MNSKRKKVNKPKLRSAKPGRTELGKKIAGLRKEQDMSQGQLAFECSVSRQYISELESGHKSPTVDTAIKIANAFGIQLKELMDFKY